MLTEYGECLRVCSTIGNCDHRLEHLCCTRVLVLNVSTAAAAVAVCGGSGQMVAEFDY